MSRKLEPREEVKALRARAEQVRRMGHGLSASDRESLGEYASGLDRKADALEVRLGDLPDRR